MIKRLFFLTSTSLILQMTLMAQNNNTSQPQLEVQIQRLPTYNEGMKDSNNAFSQERANDRQNSSVQTYNQSIENTQPLSNSSLSQSPQSQKKELTLSILKPDAVKNRHVGDIISRFEDNGLRIVGIKMVKLNKEEAAQFYNIHRDRPFFRELVDFMSSGPVVVLALEGDQAVSKNRQLMGATDPTKAEKGTIRADYAGSVSQNAVHGSDSLESAREEIPFFFKSNELYSGY